MFKVLNSFFYFFISFLSQRVAKREVLSQEIWNLKWKDQIEITIYETCFYIEEKGHQKVFMLLVSGKRATVECKLWFYWIPLVIFFFRFLGKNLRISWWCFDFLPELLISGRRAIVECMNLGGSCTIKILRAILQVAPITDPLTSLPCLPKL